MWPSVWRVFHTFLRLGLTSFGGPTAHIAAFSRLFVDRLRWLTPEEFAHDNALCQLVPGPASSQLGMLIGARQAGIAGSIAAFLGFTLPSATLLYLAARGNSVLAAMPGLTAGLLCGAAVVVTHAVWMLSKPIHNNRSAVVLAGSACLAMLLWPAPLTQICALCSAALIASIMPVFDREVSPTPSIALSPRRGAFMLATFGGVLIASALAPSVFAILFQAGALVFGGGHVVLPLLMERFSQTGILAAHTITEGYALAQLMPGPLFSIATYIGTVATNGSLWGASVATLAIFLPGWLLILGIQPWWSQIAAHRRVSRALAGTHAAVVGILAASAGDLLRTQVLGSPTTILIAVAVAIALWRNALPVWLIPFVCAIAGWFVLS